MVLFGKGEDTGQHCLSAGQSIRRSGKSDAFCPEESAPTGPKDNQRDCRMRKVRRREGSDGPS